MLFNHGNSMFQTFFGLVRSLGADDAHPTIGSFAQLFRLLSIYNPAKRIIRGNVTSAMSLDVKSKSFADLIAYYRKQSDTEQQEVRPYVENEICRRIVAGENGSTKSENTFVSATSCMAYHLAGFVAFKRRLFTNCEECLRLLCDPTFVPEASSLTNTKDMGGLSRPSKPLFCLLNDWIEPALNGLKLDDVVGKNVVLEVVNKLVDVKCENLGCNEKHSQTLASEIIMYYITIRMYFFSQHHNKESLTSIVKSKQKFKEAKLN